MVFKNIDIKINDLGDGVSRKVLANGGKKYCSWSIFNRKRNAS